MKAINVEEFFAFCPVLGEMLRTNRLVGRSGRRFEALGALSSMNNLVTLRRLALEFKPQRTLEVGLSFGGSCLVFTATHRDLGAAPVGQHVALDPFQKSVWDETGVMVAERAGLAGFLDFRSQFSSLELPALLREGRKFDFISIDGSHLFEDVFVDYFFVAQLLEQGGVMAFDDSTDPHVAKVLRFIQRNFPDSFIRLDLQPFRPEGAGHLKCRLASLLGKTQLTAFRKTRLSGREWNAPLRNF